MGFNLLGLLGLERDDANAADIGRLGVSIREIVGRTEDAEVERITGVAGLLGKVAYADMEIAPEERERIRSILVERLALPDARAREIVALLDKERGVLYRLEDHLYARLISHVYDAQKKTDLLRALFEVAATDSSISAEEDAELWTIAKELHLTHKQFIAVRSEFRESLDVLKG
jgi:uncharacterized tellurite resistance protein B-like protein